MRPTETITHIANVNGHAAKIGDRIEQAGEAYTVIGRILRRDAYGYYKPTVLYLTWDGSEDSDVFRSVIGRDGYTGQIRWESPRHAIHGFTGDVRR